MQSLTAAPRTSLTAAQVTSVLTGDRVAIRAGLEKLNTSNVLVADISDELSGGRITRDNYATVHGSCVLDLTTADLVWGKDRVRPYMVVSNSRRVGKRAIVFTTGGGHDLPYRLQGFGWNVSTVTSLPSLDTILEYDLYGLDSGFNGLDSTHMASATAAYDSGVSILTTGNDTADVGPLTTSSALSGGAGLLNPIVPVTSHPAGQGWSSFNDTDMQTYYTGLRSTVKVVGNATLSGSPVPVIFVEENPNGNGARWGHIQPYAGATPTAVTQAVVGWVAESRIREVSARFNLGVYVLTSPETKKGVEPITYEVEGYDLLHLLQSGPGDTYVVTATTTYLTAVQNVISASGVGVPITIDGTLQTTQVPATMVWAVTPQGPPTWIEIINDLLRAINYVDLWVDENGTYRSGPYTAPTTRAAEWTFDTSNRNTIIIGPEIEQSAEAWGVPNWWRFVRTRMTTKPVEGAGLYTVTDQTGTPTSINTIGRTVRKMVFLEAADQAALVAQGDRIVAEDKQNTRTYTVEVDPLPIAGHFDVVQLVDDGRSDKCLVATWELPLDGSRGRWTLEVVT